ncbi:hypothetical protein JW998_06270 [candidate division KSB1 bacterium]|nr:hypothetical protein [candidate division KSB1 bacterium]
MNYANGRGKFNISDSLKVLHLAFFTNDSIPFIMPELEMHIDSLQNSLPDSAEMCFQGHYMIELDFIEWDHYNSSRNIQKIIEFRFGQRRFTSIKFDFQKELDQFGIFKPHKIEIRRNKQLKPNFLDNPKVKQVSKSAKFQCRIKDSLYSTCSVYIKEKGASDCDEHQMEKVPTTDDLFELSYAPAQDTLLYYFEITTIFGDTVHFAKDSPLQFVLDLAGPKITKFGFRKLRPRLCIIKVNDESGVKNVYLHSSLSNYDSMKCQKVKNGKYKFKVEKSMSPKDSFLYYVTAIDSFDNPSDAGGVKKSHRVSFKYVNGSFFTGAAILVGTGFIIKNNCCKDKKNLPPPSGEPPVK